MLIPRRKTTCRTPCFMPTKQSMRQIGALTLAAMLLGCGTAPPEKKPDSVLALVAASTQDVMQEIATAFTKEHGAAVRINADASSKLATQITQGSPGDLFLSAND